MMKLSSTLCAIPIFLYIYFYLLRNPEFKKREKKRNIGDLPEDLLVEILSRVPGASLARFRSVSKRWKALIQDVLFMKQSSLIIMLIDSRVYLASINGLNGTHEDNVVEVTSQLSLKDPLSTSLEGVDISTVFHCDGLLLCSTKDNRLVVWNPRSGETSWIKPRDTYKKSDIFALGKSSCNKYKILRIALSGRQRRQVFVEPCLYEIYDFASNSWRVVDDTKDWFILGPCRRGTSVDGNTYWQGFCFSGDILLCFDFSTERFGCVSLPDDLLPDMQQVFSVSVTREEQKLCLLATRQSDKFDIDAWVGTKIESTGDMSWSKFLTVERASNHQYFVFCCGMSFLADRENKFFVCIPGRDGNSNSFLHIVGEDKYIQVDRHNAGHRCLNLLSYVPTFVQIQQGYLG